MDPYQRRPQPKHRAQEDSPQPPVVPSRKRGFRWPLLVVPLVLLISMWVYREVHFACGWEDLMEAVHVLPQNYERYTQLAVLGVLVTAVVAIYRVLRREGSD